MVFLKSSEIKLLRTFTHLNAISRNVHSSAFARQSVFTQPRPMYDMSGPVCL
jgi:hypothetical protein